MINTVKDLGETFLLNGERFVPLIELAKMFHKSKYKVTAYEYYHSDNVLHSVTCFVGNSKSRYMIYSIKVDILLNTHLVIEKLLEWHFDIYGLIEKGLAIDKNTI